VWRVHAHGAIQCHPSRQPIVRTIRNQPITHWPNSPRLMTAFALKPAYRAESLPSCLANRLHIALSRPSPVPDNKKAGSLAGLFRSH
jgi:hypothetical protein